MTKHTVDVAEATGFTFLGVVKATSPIDGDVALLSVQSRGTLHTTTRTDTAKLEETIEHRTIISDVVFSLLPHETVHIVRCDFLQEIDVIVRVKLGHFASCRRFRALQKCQHKLETMIWKDSCDNQE
jgi:hypothetical protein